MLQSGLSGKFSVKEPGLLLPLLLITSFAFVQTFPLLNTGGNGNETRRAISFDVFETRLFIYEFLALILFGELLLRYTSTDARMRKLIRVVIAVGAVSALFGIVRREIGDGLQRWILPQVVNGSGYGQFINRNHFAFLMEMSLGLTVSQIAIGVQGKGYQAIYILLAVVMWIALVRTNSRGGILSTFVQTLFFTGIFYLRRKPQWSFLKANGFSFIKLVARRAALILCLVIALGMGLVLAAGVAPVERLVTVPGELIATRKPHNEIYRVDIWRATWQLVRQHPMVGVGFAGYQVAITSHHDSSGKWVPQQAHNDYLELLASGGFVAVTLGIWFVVAFIIRARRQMQSRDLFVRASCVGALTGIVGIAFHSFVDFGLHVTINALVLTVLIVIAVVRVEKRPSVAVAAHS